MSQPKRRSRKSKLVPRSTEGGDPEIEEVIEKEEQQIKIMNTVSLASSSTLAPQPQSASKKSQSLQFKVDIEVEEWFDDELIIEENFAKMQSEKLSEELEKEINEEADWTNDDYGKLWAEVASDSETEEKPLNEYEKFIKNQIHPGLIARHSKKSDHVSTPAPKKAKKETKKEEVPDALTTGLIAGPSKNADHECAPTPKKDKKETKKEEVPDALTTSSFKQIPKPTLNVKQNIRPSRRLKKKLENAPIKQVSEVNLQPRLKINVVFNDHVPENVVTHQLDQPKSEDSHSPVKNETNTPNQVNKDDKSQKSDEEPKKITNSNMSKEKIDENPSTSEAIEDIDKILERPIYLIECNEPEKIYRSQLRQLAYKSILKCQNRNKNSDDNPEPLEHIVINEDALLSVAEELSQVNDRVTKMLSIELRNRLGSTRFENTEMSREDALVEYALRHWFAWQGLTKTRSVPLLYKCYICNDGWWHLEPFRTHIKKHSYVQVALEKHNHECNIIAHNSKSVKFKMFPIDNECWRCGKSYAFHLGLEQVSYNCTACESSLYTCLGLMEHMGLCLNMWKKQMELQSTKDVRAYKCKICPQIFFNENDLHKHQYMYHVPRSDYPMLVYLRQCSFCNQNYVVYTFHYCRSKVQKHVCKHCMKHFPSGVALNMHLQMSKENVKCEFCGELVQRDCCMMEHLVTHTDKFMLVYKCLMCPNNVMLENYMMVQKHAEYIHKSIKLSWCCAKILIPRSLFENCKHTIECKPAGKIQNAFRKFVSKERSKPLILKAREQSKNLSANDNSDVSSKQDDTSEDLSVPENTNIQLTSGIKINSDVSSEQDDTSEDLSVPENTDIELTSEIKINSVVSSEQDHTSQDLTVPENTDIELTPEIKINSDVSLKQDDTSQDLTVPQNTDIELTSEIKINSVVSSEQDHTSQDSSVPENTDMPKIKIENLMEDYFEEDSTNMETEIKIEVEDMEGTEVNETDLVVIDESVVKEEKSDDYEANTSTNLPENKFSEQLQNYLDNIDVDDEASKQQRRTYIKHNMFVCISCDFEGTKKEYKQHLENCKSGGIARKIDKRECTKCQKSFKSMKDYVKHLRVHGFILCHCKECNMTFPSLMSWSNHINSHINKTFTTVRLLSQAKVYMCKICKEIVHRNMFFKHWEVHIHQESCLEVHCDAGGNMSSYLLGIIIEIFQATLKKQVPKNCVVCGRTFSRMNEKKRHLAEHLLEAAFAERCNTGVLQCQICRAGFDKPNQFRRHMRDHACLPVYHCELCDKTFSDSSNFVKHKKVHNFKSYVCDVCNRKFLAKSSLIAHIATHCPEPITCDRCPDKKFYSESAHRRHVRHHVPNFTCNICREQFRSHKAKWDHQWEAHKIRSQKADCPACDRKFRKISDLKKHLVEVHIHLKNIMAPQLVL